MSISIISSSRCSSSSSRSSSAMSCVLSFWCMSQQNTEVPLRRSALSACPCGDPWGTLLQLEVSYSWAPYQAPKGTNTKVTSAKGHFCGLPECRLTTRSFTSTSTQQTQDFVRAEPALQGQRQPCESRIGSALLCLARERCLDLSGPESCYMHI